MNLLPSEMPEGGKLMNLLLIKAIMLSGSSTPRSTAIGNCCCEQSDHQWDQRQSPTTNCQRHHRCSNHDDYQPTGSQRRQSSLDTR
jgi:hypothetical protein